MSNSVLPEGVSSQTESSSRVQSEQSKFVQHLATYPALSALAGLIASFPVAKIFVSNAIPLLQAIHERTRPVADPLAESASPYLRSLDNAGDVLLDRIDQRFPQLHTMEPAGVYEDAQNYIGSVRSNAQAMYDAKVGQPISHATTAAREQFDTAVPKIQNIYADKLQEQVSSTEPGYIAKLLACLATGKLLSIEGYHAAVSHFGTPEKLEKAVSEVRQKVVATQKTAEQAVEDAGAEVEKIVN